MKVWFDSYTKIVSDEESNDEKYCEAVTSIYWGYLTILFMGFSDTLVSTGLFGCYFGYLPNQFFVPRGTLSLIDISAGENAAGGQ